MGCKSHRTFFRITSYYYSVMSKTLKMQWYPGIPAMAETGPLSSNIAESETYFG